MTLHVRQESGNALATALEALFAAEPDLPYAGFEPFRRRRDAFLAMHAERWRHAAESMAVFVAYDAASQPQGAIACGTREFESEHFGVPMAQLGPVVAVADEAARLDALRSLYREASDYLRQRGFVHVAAHASAGDRIAGHVLQEIGGFYVGTKIHWMAPLTGEPFQPSLPASMRINCYDDGAVPPIEPSEWPRLRAWGREGFQFGPLVVDVRLPRDAARGVYQTWTEKVMRGEWAKALYVVRDGEEIVAFNCVLPLDDMSAAAGEGIVGRGLGATLPGYRGLFTALQRTMVARRPLGARWLENETRAATVATINVFGKLGHHCVRSTATYHLHLRPWPDSSDPLACAAARA